MEQHLVANISGKVRRVNEGGRHSTVDVALPTLTPEYATGVYCWLNRVNGKRYVGSSAISLLGRMRGHRRSLAKSNHGNQHLQNAWNKYGSKRFAFVILERCAPEDCLAREQYWIDKYQSANSKFGYNKCPVAGSPRGVKHTATARANMAAAHEGKSNGPHSEETKAKIASSLMGHEGYTPNDEQRALIALKLTGLKRSPETCARIAAAQQRPEVKAKISAALTGREQTPEARANQSLSIMSDPVKRENRARAGRIGGRNGRGKSKRRKPS